MATMIGGHVVRTLLPASTSDRAVPSDLARYRWPPHGSITELDFADKRTITNSNSTNPVWCHSGSFLVHRIHVVGRLLSSTQAGASGGTISTKANRITTRRSAFGSDGADRYAC